VGRVPDETPWRDKAWLQAELDKRGGYDSRLGGAGSGACRDLADELGCSIATISGWIRRHGITPVDRTPPPPLVPIQDIELRLEGDFGVSSDWHVPITRYELLNRFLDDCVAHDLSRVIIAGDLTNQDALAGHEEKQKGANLDVELEHLDYAMRVTLDAVDRVYVTLGNHDRHAGNKLGLTFDQSLRMLLRGLSAAQLARITITNRDYALVDTDAGEWRICHTRNYSRLPLAYPSKLALRFGTHVAAGHRHHHAQGTAGNGKQVVELGGFVDEDRLAYVHRYSNDLPMMQPGYGLLIGGRMKCPMLWS